MEESSFKKRFGISYRELCEGQLKVMGVIAKISSDSPFDDELPLPTPVPFLIRGPGPALPECWFPMDTDAEAAAICLQHELGHVGNWRNSWADLGDEPHPFSSQGIYIDLEIETGFDGDDPTVRFVVCRGRWVLEREWGSESVEEDSLLEVETGFMILVRLLPLPPSRCVVTMTCYSPIIIPVYKQQLARIASLLPEAYPAITKYLAGLDQALEGKLQMVVAPEQPLTKQELRNRRICELRHGDRLPGKAIERLIREEARTEGWKAIGLEAIEGINRHDPRHKSRGEIRESP